jgi:predicted PurR-regulated permease PerM
MDFSARPVQRPVQLNDNNDRFTWFLRLATFALVVAVLEFGEDVLLPVAFAALLAFLLSPLVVRLTRAGLPQALAIIVTVTVAFSALGAIGWLVTSQAISLVRELPNYEENIRQKIVALKHPGTPTVMTRMSEMVDNLRREIKTTAPDAPAGSASTTEVKPVRVEVHDEAETVWEIARDLVSPIVRPLGTAGIVFVFVVAMLFQREDLRDRFIKLVSAGKLNVATQAVDDAANRVSRYLGMQLIVNALYGIPIGIGLYFIGIPNAPLWGLLATLLRFIPFLGPWIAAVFPVALSLAVDPGWTMLLYTLALFVVMELISNNVIEVVLYGASTGISSLALLVAAVFWTWLWGPAGLVLSTPLTVCLLVLGNYVPGMNFLSMLLGSEPVLEPPAQFYRRMLSMESEDMLDLATKHISEHSLEEFYEDVFVPALLMSEEDRHNGALPDVRERFILQSSRELIDELERLDEIARQKTETEEPTLPAAPKVAMPAVPVVLGLPARDEADELVAYMLVHLLQRRGIAAAVTPLSAPLDEAFKNADRAEVKASFISALPPSAVGAARQMCRRLKLHASSTPILVGIWSPRADQEELEKRLHASQPSKVVTRLGDAVTELEAMVTGRSAQSPQEPTPVAPESGRKLTREDHDSHTPFEPAT